MIKYVVVVPAYKHSVLVADALTSLVRQSEVEALRVVVVDDGCPYPETRDVVRAFQIAHPGLIHSVRQPNRGLSGARNTGIEVALARWPEALGIWFLDADNVLEPWALRRVGEACEADPDADWFFPDIMGFGVRFLADAAGPYDVIEHLVHNFCEAGSFVRMRVFEAGVRFDEDMKLGYEDWDFWLQAVTHGFRGRYLPDAGFRYRKRGESMIANSERDHAEIMAYMRRKHRRFFTPQRIVSLQARDRPTASFVDLAARRVLTGVDCVAPDRPTYDVLDLDGFAAAMADYERTPVGLSAYFATPAKWAPLVAAGLDQWAIWELERLLTGAGVAALRVRRGASDRIALSAAPFDLAAGHVFAIGTYRLSEVLSAKDDSWIWSLASDEPEPSLAYLTIDIPEAMLARDGGRPADPGSDVVLYDMLSFLGSTRRRRRTYGRRETWARSRQFRIGQARRLAIDWEWHGMRALFPRPERRGPDVGFVLPLAAFGGVERVAHQTARVLRRRGMTPHLVVVGATEAALPREHVDTYETIRFFRSPGDKGFGWSPRDTYYGTGLPQIGDDDVPRLAGICADLDVVINNHSAPLNLAMATLRRAGKITVATQHVIDQELGERPVGHPFFGLAFEHAYDRILAVSQAMARQLHALGLPEDKLQVVRNAGGIDIDADTARRVVAERAAREGPLRCLFMGRLDRQKGADRLADLVVGLRGHNVPAEWRIVGRAVVETGDGARDVAGVPIEPPVYDAADVEGLLAWADVVVMPSRFEGLPLLAHEAMAFGCVVVASDVGALSEIVQHGETGFLLPQEALLPAQIEVLRELRDDRERLARMAAAASERALGVTWEGSLAPFADWLERRLAPPEPAAAPNPAVAAVG